MGIFDFSVAKNVLSFQPFDKNKDLFYLQGLECLFSFAMAIFLIYWLRKWSQMVNIDQ